MQKMSLIARGRDHLEQALTASSGRSSETIIGGHENVLRQTLIALRAGEGLSDHDNPGEATVHVLEGRVLLRSGEMQWDGSVGDLIVVPNARHSLDAVHNSVILLTVAKAVRAPTTEPRPGGPVA
jgi:quercetin dioxygenase-like cupin family protein